MIDIETSSHTFIAEGLPTHNCTQVGATFTVVLKILYTAEGQSINVIYTLPTGPEAKNFVLSKFDPIMEKSPGLRSLIKKGDITKKELYNTTVKRIGNSYFFFKGSWSTWGAQAIDADVLVVDELDFQKEDVRKMFEERIEGSGSKDMIYWIGYPSVPNFGIEELYESSDQRQWIIECPHCMKRQTMRWPESINMATMQYICLLCKKVLPDESRRRGLWKARKPGRPIHGYHISKLMAPWIPAERIIDRFKKDTTRKFFNYTLGLPYMGSDSDLNDTIIDTMKIWPQELALFKAEKKPLTVIGIDQGDEFFVVKAYVTEEANVIDSYEIFSSEDDLKKYLIAQDPFAVLMDMSPNTHTAKKLQEHFGKDKFFLADEQTRHSTLNMMSYYDLKHGESRVNIQRTDAFDTLYDDMANGKIRINAEMKGFRTKDKTNPGYVDMLLNLVPDTQERFGRPVRVWKARGPDHLAHSTCFINVMSRILYPNFGRFQAEKIIVPDAGPVPWYVEDFEKAMGNGKKESIDYTLILPKGLARRQTLITPREV